MWNFVYYQMGDVDIADIADICDIVRLWYVDMWFEDCDSVRCGGCTLRNAQMLRFEDLDCKMGIFRYLDMSRFGDGGIWILWVWYIEIVIMWDCDC